MSRIINVHEAKTQFSRLLDKAHAGEEIVLYKAGKPYARLVPLKPAGTRSLGFLSGEVGPEFFEPLPQTELDAWQEK